MSNEKSVIEIDNELAREIANFFQSKINRMGFPSEKVAAEIINCHRTIQQSIVQLCFHIIKAVSEQKHYDMRNEASVKQCQKIMALIQYPDLPFI